MLIGGDSKDGPLSSVEPLGFPANCMIPDLPEKRYGAGSFVAPQLDGQLTVCGGWWDGKPNSTDCLTLNKEEGRWERGHLKGTPGGTGAVKGVISLDGIGVYLVHSSSMSFLAWSTQEIETPTQEIQNTRDIKTPEDKTSWNEIATPLADIQCATSLNEFRFVIIGGRKLESVLEYKIGKNEANPGQSGWQDTHRWPNLKQGRRGPGCGATKEVLIIAGGVTGWDVILDTVEIFQLKSRALGVGGVMIQARAFFSLVPVGETFIRLLAVGGESDNGVTLNTTEWWNQDDDEWEEGPLLDTPRSGLAASLVPVKLVCGSSTDGSFCQTVQGNPCTECALNEDKNNFVCSSGENEELCDQKKCPLLLEERASKKESQKTGGTVLRCIISNVTYIIL